MSNHTRDHWIGQTKLSERDDVDALRKVLDPNDVTGIKNRYIDCYLKHYLSRHLDPRKEDVLLDFGCGIGRLSEFMAPLVRSVYGVDVIDEFIDYCRANPKKNENTFYLKSTDVASLRDVAIDKAYIVWVLTCILDDSEIVSTLSAYRQLLPSVKKVIVVEQVKRHTLYQKQAGKDLACYRTVDQYTDIFTQSGFKVRNCDLLGERHHGLLYKCIHFTGNLLPERLNRFSEKLFRIDQRLMGDCTRRTDLINDRKPTDVVFELEIDAA